jgi:hypothetical protein
MSRLTFTALEEAVLLAMCSRATNESIILHEQIEQAMVLDRVNTGAGFYTHILCREGVEKLRQKTFANVFALYLR